MIAETRLPGEIEYFRRRAIEEQVAAGNAAGKEARRRHDELAMMYRFKVAMLSTAPDSWAAAFSPGLIAESAEPVLPTAAYNL